MLSNGNYAHLGTGGYQTGQEAHKRHKTKFLREESLEPGVGEVQRKRQQLLLGKNETTYCRKKKRHPEHGDALQNEKKVSDRRGSMRFKLWRQSFRDGESKNIWTDQPTK